MKSSKKPGISNCPRISVVIEGYNQSRELGVADDTIAAIQAQEFPLETVEVILVGAPEQVKDWDERYGQGGYPFRIRTLGVPDAHYYQLKNHGADIAEGDIIAFTDSDVQPRKRWLASILEGIEAGADATMGPSLFKQSGGMHPDSPFMRMAAVVTWGWVMGPRGPDGTPVSRGFMDHNIAMRADVFRKFKYRTEFGRVVASPLLYSTLVEAGYTVSLQREQIGEHHFSWSYWLIGLEYRYGHEVYRLRRLDPNYPNQWISKTGPLEPLVTLFWHIALDVPKWFRFTSVLGAGLLYQIAFFPIYLLVSLTAHISEMFGMISTMVRPKKTREWAESV